jgi:hypothetical protein
VKVEEPFMPTRAANADRARIVRSLLSLAIVGTLLVATLVPLPGLHGRLKNAASPSVALCDWERRNWEQRSIDLAEWKLAVRAAQQVRSKRSGSVSSDEVWEVAFAKGEMEVHLQSENDAAERHSDDASRP